MKTIRTIQQIIDYLMVNYKLNDKKVFTINEKENYLVISDKKVFSVIFDK